MVPCDRRVASTSPTHSPAPDKAVVDMVESAEAGNTCEIDASICSNGVDETMDAPDDILPPRILSIDDLVPLWTSSN